MTMPELRRRVRGVIARTFEITDAELPVPADVDSVVKWDSLGHMELIEALEQEFDIEIEHADAVLLLGEAEIVDHLAARLPA
jgi:acyl carrier protein